MPYVDLDTLHTPTAGTRPPASWGEAVRENFELVSPWGAWEDFTPTAKFGATTASITNGSRYMRIGRLIIAKYAIRFTNLNSGTGTFTISLPVTAKTVSSPASNYVEPIGTATLFDINTGSNVYPHFCTINATTDMVMRSMAAPGVVMTNTAPVTIAVGGSGTGDEFWATVEYEAAADA
jgi:hypothetical protein